MRRRLLTTVLVVLGIAGPRSAAAQDADAGVRSAVADYNRAFTQKDLAALKALLGTDIVLYEHSVRNLGLDDVWEHHLKPEIEAFENMRADFSDMRVWVSGDVALVTRQYDIRATMKGQSIEARGNETMGWARRQGRWQVVHIHYSHPCPRPAAPAR